MKEKFELIPMGDASHLIRKFKKHRWSKWEIEMDGATPKIYPVDQEHCEHDYEFVRIVISMSYPAGTPWRLMRCKKCGRERVTLPQNSK